jgi:hypothetical protein
MMSFEFFRTTCGSCCGLREGPDAGDGAADDERLHGLGASRCWMIWELASGSPNWRRSFAYRRAAS